MRVIYFSQPFFSDCDFPLVKELQNKSIDVRYYIPLHNGFQKSSILEFPKKLSKWGIYRASKFKEMEPYKDCVDLERLFFICGTRKTMLWPFSWILWLWVCVHMISQKADVFHITWQLSRHEKLLYYVPLFRNKVFTIHDPIQHSSFFKNKKNEDNRIKSIEWSDKFILLNSKQVELFANEYKIPRNKIFVSQLGIYNSIAYMNLPSKNVRKYKEPYILFFGQIYPHKGVEYLLNAMTKVHEICPNVKLVVAGGGDYYFDISPFQNTDYIYIENRYIGIQELVGMIRDSSFVVCPYKDATQSGVVQTSFALEKPVIATNVGALPTAVVDGKYGMIVPPCDVLALRDAIVFLLSQSDLLDTMKRNIRDEWIPSMSWSQIANDYIKCYNHKNC